MSMSRKDFVMLANAIKDLPLDFTKREIVAVYIAAAINRHSSTFDKSRFIEACLPSEKP